MVLFENSPIAVELTRVLALASHRSRLNVQIVSAPRFVGGRDGTYLFESVQEKQCSAFFAGLSEIIPERFLRLFNQSELRVLVGECEVTYAHSAQH